MAGKKQTKTSKKYNLPQSAYFQQAALSWKLITHAMFLSLKFTYFFELKITIIETLGGGTLGVDYEL